jgi:hypothetical protein
MNEEVDKKLRIENLTRCLNCSVFVTCKEPYKENAAECDHFEEIQSQKQVVVIGLAEWAHGGKR